MKIEGIVLTKCEMNQAIAGYLKLKGLAVNVTGVDSRGYPIKEWTVSIETTENHLDDPITATLVAEGTEVDA